MTPSSDTSLRNPGASFLAQPPAHAFAPEDFGSDDRLMIETAEQFSRKEVLPLVERLDHQEDGLMPGLIRKAGELGLVGVDAPEEYGGLGLGKNLAARILEFMSLNGSFSVTYGITSGISQVGLSLFGTEEQKARYLPSLTSGEWIGAYALSEPNSGSDALSATTRADRTADGFILNGTKMWISNAKWADLFLVMAKVDGERFSAFLVPRDAPGVSISREEYKMGLKGSSTARLVLEDARVPLDALLHNEGQGHHVAFNALNIGRFKLASMSIGPARAAMGDAAAYAQDRRQFGQPIANFGLIQKKFAMMAAWFFLAESAIYRTGALIDEAFAAYGGTVDGNRRAAEEYAIECSCVKVLATELEGRIVDEALQVYGGYGFTEEFPLARHYRDARVSRIYEGTNEINRLFVADRFRKRIKEGRVSGEIRDEGFVASLLTSALDAGTPGQIEIGALSDLILLGYAEQSARLRASRVGGAAADLYACATPWLNAQAAEAYQTLTGDSVTLPAVSPVDIAELASKVYLANGPL
jgi:alkylation response protein AidB-like acyl-CoA dehydrogenase